MEKVIMKSSLAYEYSVKEALVELRKELQEFGCHKCKGFKHINHKIDEAIRLGKIKEPGDIKKVLKK